MHFRVGAPHKNVIGFNDILLLPVPGGRRVEERSCISLIYRQLRVLIAPLPELFN